MGRQYDNLVIGFGKGGKTLAGWLAKNGEEVAIVERSTEMYGGACINIACIPTKSLIHNAENEVPYKEAFNIKNELTAQLRAANYEKLDSLEQVSVITGEASFLSSDEVQVILNGTGQKMRIQAKRIFINTGARPFLPPVQGLDSSKYVFTSTSLLDAPRLAKEIAIIGGGFIGLEFADMYAKFGAKVTILERGQTFLPKEDRDVAQEIHQILSGKNIDIIMDATVDKVTDVDGEKVKIDYTISLGNVKSLEVSAILVATGRKPNTESLNLQVAGIKTDESGFVEVDDLLRTSASNIWAIGDVNGGPQFTYISLDDFRVIKGQLSQGNYTSVKQRKGFASAVFITPPLAHIGLREKEAKEQGYQYKVAKLPVKNIPRAKIDGSTQGFFKAIVDTKTDKILGCTLISTEAHEIINTIQIAMNSGLDYQVIRDSVYTHPSMSEAFNDLFSLI